MPRVPLTVLAVAAVALPGCAAVQAADQDPPATAAAGVRADTLVGVARRIYRQEADGAVGHAAVRRIARDPALRAAMRSGSPAALRAAALRQLFNPGKHVVRLSVMRGGRTLTDVGGRFVVSPAQLTAQRRRHRGLDAGRHRLREARPPPDGSGRGRQGRPGARRELTSRRADTALPAAGSATVAGRSYVVRSFREVGFSGEALQVWVLTP